MREPPNSIIIEDIDWSFEGHTVRRTIAIKLSRGRPRKPRAFDGFRDMPPHIARLNNAYRNIDIEQLKRNFEKHRGEVEQDRRQAVSEAVRAAFRAGRNTANTKRQNAKKRALLKTFEDNAKLIASSRMTLSNLAARIVERGKNHGLGKRAILDELSKRRKTCKAKST